MNAVSFDVFLTFFQYFNTDYLLENFGWNSYGKRKKLKIVLVEFTDDTLTVDYSYDRELSSMVNLVKTYIFSKYSPRQLYEYEIQKKELPVIFERFLNVDYAFHCDSYSQSNDLINVSNPLITDFNCNKIIFTRGNFLKYVIDCENHFVTVTKIHKLEKKFKPEKKIVKFIKKHFYN